MSRLRPRRSEAIPVVVGRTMSDRSGPSEPIFIAVLVRTPGNRDRQDVALASRLSECGAAVLAVDTGRDALISPAALSAEVDDVTAIVDRVSAGRVSRPVVLIGHGHGAAVCVRAAQLRSDECAALVLWDPSLGGEAEPFAARLISSDAPLGPLPTLLIHPRMSDPLNAAIESIRGDAFQEYLRTQFDDADALPGDHLVDLVIRFIQRALRWETMLP